MLKLLHLSSVFFKRSVDAWNTTAKLMNIEVRPLHKICKGVRIPSLHRVEYLYLICKVLNIKFKCGCLSCDRLNCFCGSPASDVLGEGVEAV